MAAAALLTSTYRPLTTRLDQHHRGFVSYPSVIVERQVLTLFIKSNLPMSCKAGMTISPPLLTGSPLPKEGRPEIDLD